MTTTFPERTPAAGYDGQLPECPRPIIVVAAGGIVQDDSLRAYRKAGFPIWALVDGAVAEAQGSADACGAEHVFASVEEAVGAAPRDAVYDIAATPEQYPIALQALPDGAGVLMRELLGQTLAEGIELARICRRKGLVAAVDTPLRLSPPVARARKLIAEGLIGEVYDMEIRAQEDTALRRSPDGPGLGRPEIGMQGMRCIDLVRSFFGDPDGVSAVAVRNPAKAAAANARSTILMRYRDRPLRVTITTGHDHVSGAESEESFVRWDGTAGTIRAQCPSDGPDTLQIVLADAPERGWRDVPADGSWPAEASIGSMAVLQRFIEGTIEELPQSVDDVLRTMAAVEAAQVSQEREGVSLDPAARGPRSGVRRIASVIGLPAENRAAYEEYHRAVWPGVLRRITASNIRNYSIYRDGETLFSYYEYVGDDYEADMAAMAEDADTQAWWAVQEPLQRPFDDRQDGEWWKTLPEVFHQD